MVELTIVKSRIYVPEGQNYVPNDSAESRLFEGFYSLYEKLIPNPDERESREETLKVARGQLDCDKGVSEIYCAVNGNGKVVGYRTFDTVTMGHREDGAFGASWYIGVDPDERRNGYGSKLADATTDEMKRLAASRGRDLILVHEEMDDPERMTPEQIKGRRDIKDVYDMVRWAGKHYMEVVVDGRGDWFIQPRLDEKSEPAYHLISGIAPLDPELKENKEMSADKFLKKFLWKYVYRGYKEIPGSSLNGRRDPDTDESYKEMRRRIELAGKVRLVPLER